VNITEIPNQTSLDAVLEDNASVNSLKRRISILAKTHDVDIDFDAVVTHDLSNTIAELSDQAECDWLVVGWTGRAHDGILIHNPIGWLTTHINSDLALFKDNGIRYIGKVLLALRPGRKDKNFVAVADRICQFYNASLTLLHIVPIDYPKEKEEAIGVKANQILSKASSPSKVRIQRSDDAKESISNISAKYDLLILGTPERDHWLRLLFGSGKDKFAESSVCSVLRLTMKD
jgi:nucleotide-binding universal stress UspA family protein